MITSNIYATFSSPPPTGVFGAKTLIISAAFSDKSNDFSEDEWSSLHVQVADYYYHDISYGKVTLTPANEN